MFNGLLTPDALTPDALTPDAPTPDALTPDALTPNAPATDAPTARAASGPAITGVDRPPAASLFALVVVAWSPAMQSATEPPGLSARLTELAEWEQLAGDDYGGTDVIVWRPGVEQLRRLELIGRHGDREALLQALEASVEIDGRTLSALAASPLPQDFLEARAAYRRALAESGRGGAELSELQTCQSAYEQQLHKELVGPLLQWGAESLDPRERARCTVAAETCELFLRVAPLVAAEFTEFASRGGALGRSLSRQGGLHALMTLAKAFTAFAGRRD